nr:hypothetical protein [Paracoccus isoporae]
MGQFPDRLGFIALGQPVLERGDIDLGDVADAVLAPSVRETVQIQIQRRAARGSAENDLVFIEAAGVGIDSTSK